MCFKVPQLKIAIIPKQHIPWGGIPWTPSSAHSLGGRLLAAGWENRVVTLLIQGMENLRGVEFKSLQSQSSALPGVLLIAAKIFSFLKKGWDSKIWFQKWKVQRILQVSVVITSGSSEQTVDRQWVRGGLAPSVPSVIFLQIHMQDTHHYQGHQPWEMLLIEIPEPQDWH